MNFGLQKWDPFIPTTLQLGFFISFENVFPGRSFYQLCGFLSCSWCWNVITQSFTNECLGCFQCFAVSKQRPYLYVHLRAPGIVFWKTESSTFYRCWCWTWADDIFVQDLLASLRRRGVGWNGASQVSCPTPGNAHTYMELSGSETEAVHRPLSTGLWAGAESENSTARGASWSRLGQSFSFFPFFFLNLSVQHGTQTQSPKIRSLKVEGLR